MVTLAFLRPNSLDAYNLQFPSVRGILLTVEDSFPSSYDGHGLPGEQDCKFLQHNLPVRIRSLLGDLSTPCARMERKNLLHSKFTNSNSCKTSLKHGIALSLKNPTVSPHGTASFLCCGSVRCAMLAMQKISEAASWLRIQNTSSK